MELLVLALFSLSNIACFLIGAKTGNKVAKGEDVELPTVNPMELYREQQAKKEADRIAARRDAILRNIDSYDGTSRGQEDVPR